MIEMVNLAELIDLPRLRSLLERLHSFRKIPVAVIGHDGTLLADYNGDARRNKRSHSPYGCIIPLLQKSTPGSRSQVLNCSHACANLVFPIMTGPFCSGWLVLYHIAHEQALQMKAVPNPQAESASVQEFPEYINELKVYYAELADMLAYEACLKMEHERSSQALAERDRLFHLVTDNMIDSIWLMDLNLNFTYATPSVYRKRGYTMEEMRSIPLDRHMTAESYRKATQMMVDSLQLEQDHDNINYTVDMEYYRKDGSTFWSETHLRFVRNEEGRVSGILGVGRDITERKLAEQRILHLNQELESRVRERTAQLHAVNKDLESFSYSVAHDLKAPLRAMDGFSRILLDDFQDGLDEQGRHYLNRIRQASSKMSQLIDGLLRLSQVSRQSLFIRHTDLARLAQEAIDELRSSEPGRQLQFTSPKKMIVIADTGLMRIAMNNLVANAWKFTSQRDEARIELGLEERPGETVVYIKDNGVGFENSSAIKLFQPFQRLHRQDEFDGSGIGLAIVHKIIERHHGEIWAESSPGQGARFIFTLPLDRQRSELDDEILSVPSSIPLIPPVLPADPQKASMPE